ncbi:SAM-dependent methyltransferase [Sinorhizobium sp. 8-89]|uniref:SAM-dependent methyltransferase n=1 Tax=Sinorhizobium sp. 7-81 TaxID=3049087 RepID=UPI0024C310DF|nr:SAM-dependent methyltransferase [Sinorhizobium sp. 7-81]MDK1386348.1 SAM-dependent methyltransferase [Sinorhizobium sp. 7-81]
MASNNVYATNQSRVLDLVKTHGSYRCDTQSEQRAAIRLNERGLIRRDKKDGFLWHDPDAAAETAPTGEGGEGGPGAPETGAARLPAPVDATEVVIPRYDASDLLATVERARKLLDDGDVIAARMLASAAYDQAKVASQWGERFKAAEKLVGKARQLQGDALLIETRAKIRISREWDAAHAAGLVSKGGRPKPVSGGNGLTAEDVGLSRKEIFEARKLAAAEEQAPGIVERAIHARLAVGLEPSRANLRAAVGTSSATKEERGNNLYETPIEGMHTLIALEQFSSMVLDPSCGRGASSRPLEDAGYTVSLADLADYGTADRFGEVQRVEDFLTSEALPERPDIVTNPPYGALLNRFVAHALKVHRPRKMALLLNLNFLCGFDDDDRNFVMDENPPARVWVFRRRLPMMHRDGWDGPEAQSRMNTAWFVWEEDEAGGYGSSTIIRRVDWKDYLPAEQAEAAE